MDLSFNPADVAGAQQQGVDVEEVRLAIIDHLERYFAEAPSVPPDLPETIEQFRAEVPALVDLQAYYRRAEEVLLVELREEVEPRGVKLQGAGSSPSLDVVVAGAYGEPSDRVAELTRGAKASLLPHQQLSLALRIGFNSPGMGAPLLSEEQHAMPRAWLPTTAPTVSPTTTTQRLPGGLSNGSSQRYGASASEGSPPRPNATAQKDTWRFRKHRFANTNDYVAGSVTIVTWSTGTFSSVWVRPLGHSMTISSTTVTFPTPNSRSILPIEI